MDKELVQFYDVVLSALKEGQIFKSRKALAEALGEKYKRGDSQIIQTAKWNCFFSFHKMQGSNSLIIDKIYTKNEIKKYTSPARKKTRTYKPIKELPLNERMERIFTKSTSKYLEPFFYLLLDYSVQQNKRRENPYNFTVSNSDLMVQLGVVNRKYIKFNKDLLKKISCTDSYEELRKYKEPYIFKLVVIGLYNEIFHNVIKSLKKYGIIEKYFIEHYVEEIGGSIRFATWEEKDIIDDVFRRHKNISVYKFNQKNETINKALISKKKIVKYSGSVNHFILNQELVCRTLDKEDRKKYQIVINENFVNRLSTLINYRIKKLYEDYHKYKNRTYKYPFDCGDIEKCLNIMFEYMDKNCTL